MIDLNKETERQNAGFPLEIVTPDNEFGTVYVRPLRDNTEFLAESETRMELLRQEKATKNPDAAAELTRIEKMLLQRLAKATTVLVGWDESDFGEPFSAEGAERLLSLDWAYGQISDFALRKGDQIAALAEEHAAKKLKATSGGSSGTGASSKRSNRGSKTASKRSQRK